MTWSPEVPYNALPPLPPAAEQESRRVLKATVSARSELAALRQAARLLPNPAILLNAATLLEAQASSEIENIVTTTDDLFRYSTEEESTDPAIKEALRYRAAMYDGVAAISRRPLTFQTAEKVCTRIKDIQMTVRRMPGTLIANPITRRIVYSPPEGEDVIREKLANWERYLHHDDDIDPLVRMAVAHYQFEAIHPFHDGNGRTGRILNILALVEAGLIDEPVLYLSRYIIRRKGEYYRLLNAVTREATWEEWILYLLRAVELTARSTLLKIALLQYVQEEVSDLARAATRGGRDAAMLSLLFEQPYTRIRNVMERCGVSRPTATAWLSDLAGADVLAERRLGRERLFVNERFLRVLTNDELDEVDPLDLEPAET